MDDQSAGFAVAPPPSVPEAATRATNTSWSPASDAGRGDPLRFATGSAPQREQERPAPPVSVVIPTCNRAQHLREAVEGVLTGTLDDLEVLVMDQSDDDATERCVASLADARVRYVRMHRRGACPARTFGAAMARAELIAWLDDDCVPLPDWLERIARAFERDPGLQFIFGELRAPEQRRAGGGYPEFRPGAFSARARRRDWRVAMVAAGANMSARKRFLREVGAFDESLGPARPDVKSNDASMAYKVWRSGASWVATSRIAVVHKNGFREERDLRRLYTGYSHGLGVHYGRFARRGDRRALTLFAREQFALLRWPLGRLARLEKPVGLRPWLAHLRGFCEGVRLRPEIGYVSGEIFVAIESLHRRPAAEGK